MCVMGMERNRSLRTAGQTIDPNLYYQQLERLCQAIEKKRPELINRNGIIFHHNNAKLHTSLMTHQKLKELD